MVKGARRVEPYCSDSVGSKPPVHLFALNSVFNHQVFIDVGSIPDSFNIFFPFTLFSKTDMNIKS